MTAAILRLETDRGDTALAGFTRNLCQDLAKSDVSVHPVKQVSQPGEKGDIFSLGQLALDLVTSGAVTALVECLKAYLKRDKTLRFTITRPNGPDIKFSSKNVNEGEILTELKSLAATK